MFQHFISSFRFPRSTLAIALVWVVAQLLTACHAPASHSAFVENPAGASLVYTRTGMFANADRSGVWQIKSANYIHGAKVLPAGTALTLHTVGDGVLHLTDSTGARLQARYETKHTMTSFDAWRERQFSATPVTLPSTLTEQEQRCVREARAEIGISREALFLAIGYPAASLSPDPLARTLLYATDTWGKKRISFDDTGKVSEILD
ncbi:MAG: hypothetical protein IT454_07245 [Planctomycetes bacterium]|nr:hypothetical protein [Planctomycetota bacterium]